MSNRALALLEPSPLELWQVRGGGLVRLLRGLIPEVWSTAFERMSKYEALLAPHVGEGYSQDRVSDALENDDLAVALARVTEATMAIADRHPVLRAPTPVWMLVPWRLLLRDGALRRRAARTVRATHEVMTSVRNPELGLALVRDLHTSDAARESLTWFVYDPDVPVEVAKRLLAGVRGRVTMDLIHAANRRHCWSDDDLEHALRDWMDSTEYSLGALASYPGMVVPSLPRSQLFDLKGELERHAQRRSRLSEEALRAADELKK